jgi:hypothetical protein
VLLLHDVFDYGYDEIAAIVDKSEPAVRQLAVRARSHVEQNRPRFQTSREERDELARLARIVGRNDEAGAGRQRQGHGPSLCVQRVAASFPLGPGDASHAPVAALRKCNELRRINIVYR